VKHSQASGKERKKEKEELISKESRLYVCGTWDIWRGTVQTGSAVEASRGLHLKGERQQQEELVLYEGC